jgi:mannose/fructose/N-acetylgalactosamine-specific phosphotransferase system component IID
MKCFIRIETFINMILGIILVGGLISLAMKWQKPVLSAAIYSVVKVSIQAVFFFLHKQSEVEITAVATGLLLGLVVSFLIAWLITWLLFKFREKTWAVFACVPLAILLLVV